MNCDCKFRLTLAIMKSTADIFLVPNASNVKRVIKHIWLDIAFNDRPIIAVKIGF
jgi:hypothetical protein